MTAPAITPEHAAAVRDALIAARHGARECAQEFGPGHSITELAERQVDLLAEVWGWLTATASS